MSPEAHPNEWKVRFLVLCAQTLDRRRLDFSGYVAMARSGTRTRRLTVSLNGGYGWSQLHELPSPNKTVGQTPRFDQVNIVQPIIDGVTIPAAKQARALVDAGRAQLKDIEETVMLAATTAFFYVVKDEKVVALEQDDIARLRKILGNVKSRFELGELTKTDESQTEARLKAAEIALANAKNQLEQSRAAFEHIVGRPAESLDDQIPKIPLPGSETEAVSVAIDENPAILAARAQARASDYVVDEAVGVLLPTLSVVRNTGQRSTKRVLEFTRGASR